MNDIDLVLRKNNLLDAYQENTALLVWDHVIGSRLGRYARSAYVRDRILTVYVSSSTVAHELSLLKSKLLKDINEHIKPHRVRDIRFVQGSIPRPHVPIERIHDECGEADARALFADLDDPSLASRFIRLVASQKDREASLLAAGGRRCLRCGAVYLGDADECPGCRYDD